MTKNMQNYPASKELKCQATFIADEILILFLIFQSK